MSSNETKQFTNDDLKSLTE